ncbi:MAG TPA: hypothetical protein PKI11_10045 [Candidatus Hydrogenedentes bacterium]|nr:hypothetical protein [Candidatus Hydrogenedentota bacterium]
MIRWSPVFMCCLILLVATASIAHAAAFEEVEADILDAWSKVRTLKADLALETMIEEESTMTATGDVTMLVVGDAAKYRQRITMKIEGPMALDMTMDSVYDGQELYIVNEVLGQKTLLKTQPGAGEDIPPPGGKILLDRVKEDFTVSVGEDRKVGAARCYVLECVPKNPAEGIARLLVFMNKKTGVAAGMEIYPEVGAPIMVRYTNVRINSDVDPAQFVFTAPEGVAIAEETPAAAPVAEQQETPPAAPVEEPEEAPPAAAPVEETDQAPPAAAPVEEPEEAPPAAAPSVDKTEGVVVVEEPEEAPPRTENRLRLRGDQLFESEGEDAVDLDAGNW